jgi:predicted HD superfamily hydrolase involved in NAD metabolism
MNGAGTDNMMTINEITAQLKKMLSPRRFTHSLKVMEASIKLAEKYGEDVEKAALAGLVHDCAKNLKSKDILILCDKYGIIVDDIMREDTALLHGMVGSHLARELFGIEDSRILAAIADHTMGRAGMDTLGRILFVADYIEETRDFEGVEEIREAAKESLEKAILKGVDITILHVLKKGGLLHPQTIATRNWALEEERAKRIKTEKKTEMEAEKGI